MVRLSQSNQLLQYTEYRQHFLKLVHYSDKPSTHHVVVYIPVDALYARGVVCTWTAGAFFDVDGTANAHPAVRADAGIGAHMVHASTYQTGVG